MDKNNAILEITSTSLRLVIGYSLDDKVYALYALSNPIPKGIIVNGVVANMQALVEEIKKISSIKDPSAKLKIKISDVTLCLPPYGLKVFNSTQVTTVIADDSRVGLIDIRNIYALINKEKVPAGNKIVDIIPEQFVLDSNRVYDVAPVNEISNTVTMSAKVHTLPINIVQQFEGAVKSAGIHVSRAIVSPFGASELIASYNAYPTNYFLVDVGADVTTVSLIGSNQLFGSTFFAWGGENITRVIAERFEIDEEEARKYKELYGYSHRHLNFEPTVCKSVDEQGNTKKHTLSQLNEIIKEQLNEFIEKLNSGVNQLLVGYDSSFRELPIVMVGGGSLLDGMKEFVEPKIPNSKVFIASPDVIGARHPSFMNCVGVLKAAGKYTNVYDETHPKISSVSRVKE